MNDIFGAFGGFLNLSPIHFYTFDCFLLMLYVCEMTWGWFIKRLFLYVNLTQIALASTDPAVNDSLWQCENWSVCNRRVYSAYICYAGYVRGAKQV